MNFCTIVSDSRDRPYPSEIIVPVRNLDARSPRRRLLMLLVAGSIGINALSAKAQESNGPRETAATKKVIAAQPAAGPFGEFRISRRPLFRSKRNEGSRSTLKFQSPKSETLSPNIPQPPASAAEPAAKPIAATGEFVKGNQPNGAAKPSNPIRSQHPTTDATPPTARATPPSTSHRLEPVSGGGWVARQAINQDQPLRDPRSASAKRKTPMRPAIAPENKTQASAEAREKKRKPAVPESETSPGNNQGAVGRVGVSDDQPHRHRHRCRTDRIGQSPKQTADNRIVATAAEWPAAERPQVQSA